MQKNAKDALLPFVNKSDLSELVPIENKVIVDLFDTLDQFELSYAYRGNFTQQLTDSILALSETKLEVTNEPVKNRKKVYFIMVESLQNITRHQDSEILDGFFSIHKSKSGFLITSGNAIDNQNIQGLREKLEKINSMNQDQLKEYYYEVLNAGGFSEKGGAGLGLIEMVRKSGNKLTYDFTEVDDKHSFFYFQINVSTGGEETPAGINLDSNLHLAKSVHQVLSLNKVKLFFHGHFEHEGLKGLISMTEKSMSQGMNSALKKTVVSVMIEMLQNIAYHGVDLDENSSEKPGMIMLCEDKKGYSMVTGNFMRSENITKLRSHVEKVNLLDQEGLEDAYNEALLREHEPGQKGAGLGMIDLRFKTKGKITVDFVTKSPHRAFLIMKAGIEA